MLPGMLRVQFPLFYQSSKAWGDDLGDGWVGNQRGAQRLWRWRKDKSPALN